MNKEKLSNQLKEIKAFLLENQALILEKEKRIELERHPKIKAFLKKPSYLRTYVSGLSDSCSIVIYSLIFLEQTQLFDLSFTPEDVFERLRLFTQPLIEVERFYEDIGGLIGYHALFLSFLLENHSSSSFEGEYPQGIDLTQKKGIQWGAFLQHLPELALVFPVAGAGERLGLLDTNNQPLPVAHLKMAGVSLLEHLFRDLEALEYLYFKCTGKSLHLPVALMTSQVHGNHEKIQSLIEEKGLNKGRELYLFKQPLVPVLSSSGKWLQQGFLQLILRPGGHGALWTQGLRENIWPTLLEKGVKKLLIRQINNPIAGIDRGLVDFLTEGFDNDYAFGFASCLRRVGAPEGMIVKRHHENKEWLSNVEYTDFQKNGLEDQPKEKGSSYSLYPANTNILFVDLQSALEMCEKQVLFAPTLNLKTSYSCQENGKTVDQLGGRVESMMQSLSDAIRTTKGQKAKSFLTFNTRLKTLSVCKKAYRKKEGFKDTPLDCFYDCYLNNYELLEEYCKVQLGEKLSQEVFYKNPHLPFFFFYHPALGPLFSIISQKILGGIFSQGAYLQIETPEVDIKGLKLKGALRIKNSAFSMDRESVEASCCSLIDCTVENLGPDFSSLKPQNLWEGDYPLKGGLDIYLGKNAEFQAEGVRFLQGMSIIVPDYMKMIAYNDKDEVKFHIKDITCPTWQWKYIKNKVGVTLEKSYERRYTAPTPSA